jgi:hypothetical protein
VGIAPSASHLGDFIEDKNAILPIDAAIQSDLRETTTHVLASLTPREERILRMRFGIGMNSDHTLEEVGNPFFVTASASARSKRRHCGSSSTRADQGPSGASSTIDPAGFPGAHGARNRAVRSVGPRALRLVGCLHPRAQQPTPLTRNPARHPISQKSVSSRVASLKIVTSSISRAGVT